MEALTLLLGPAVLVCLFLIDCFGEVPDIPRGNLVAIHQNPKVGDFAVTIVDGKTRIRKEVVKVEDNNITYSKKFTYLNPDEAAFNDSYKNAIDYSLIDLKGNVLKEWTQFENGEIRNYSIAKPGGNGSIQNYTKLNVKDQITKPVRTKAGRLKVDNVYTFFQHLDLKTSGIPAISTSMVEYQSNVVPFKTIRLETYVVPDKDAFIFTFVNASEYFAATVKSYTTGNPMSLYNAITKERKVDYKSKLELVGYGFGK